MKQNKIFDKLWDDSTQNRTIINGSQTGLFNLNDVKYKWITSLYQVMVGNFWLPEKVKWLWEDAIQFEKELSENEKTAYKWILSFLIFLDSIQATNLPNFSEYITAPEIKLLLWIQSYQEVIHNQSYATILESVVDSKDRENIYYFWRNDETLLERNEFIWKIYQDFKDTPTDDNFFKAVIANFLLESIYFYNWFAFFDTLANNWKMLATDRMISYIRRDELTHITLFSNIIREIKKEFPEIYDEEVIKEMMKIAVEQEIKWSKHILWKSIIWMSHDNIENYTKWLANNRLNMIWIKPLYEWITKNPYQHLERMQDNNSEKWNFFESTVTNYTQSSSMKWTWEF